jgi:hypothetical protein
MSIGAKCAESEAVAIRATESEMLGFRGADRVGTLGVSPFEALNPS